MPRTKRVQTYRIRYTRGAHYRGAMTPAAARPRTSSTGAARALRGTRLRGVDAARGIALLGMIATHIMALTRVSETPEGFSVEPTWVGLLFAGKSSALFAVVAGVGLALMTSTRGAPERAGRPHRGPRLAWDRRYVAVRAVLLAVVGMACGLLEMNVAVILVHYALLFLCALPFLGLGVRALAGWTVGWVLLSPVLAGLIAVGMRSAVGAEEYTQGWRLWSNPTFTDLLSQPALLVWDVLLTGYYPVLQWVGYVLFGLSLGRLPLGRWATGLALAVGGAVVAAGAFGLSWMLLAQEGVRAELAERTGVAEDQLDAQLLTGSHLSAEAVQGEPLWFMLAAPHTGTPLDLLLTCGTSALVLGVCLVVVRALDAVPGGVLSWVVLPLAGAGALPLTLYVGHLIALDLFEEPTFDWPRVSLTIVYWTACLVIGALVRGFGRRGPLEWGIGQVAGTLAGPRP